MKTITYTFADGTTQTVEVDEALYALHEKLDKQERRNNKRETRRHTSLNYLNDNGIDFADGHGDLLSTLIEKEDKQEFDKFLSAILTQKQIKVFKLRVLEELSRTEIGRLMGVSRQALTKQLKTIYKKIKQFS